MEIKVVNPQNATSFVAPQGLLKVPVKYCNGYEYLIFCQEHKVCLMIQLLMYQGIKSQFD